MDITSRAAIQYDFVIAYSLFTSKSADEEEDKDYKPMDNECEIITKTTSPIRIKYAMPPRATKPSSSPLKLGTLRHRHQFHRGVKKFTRIFIGVLSLLLVFVIYLPVYISEPVRYVPLSDWAYNTSRNLVDYISPGERTTLIEPKNMCEDKVFLTIVVCSAVHNFAERQMIRETWGNLSEFNYGLFHQLHAHLSDQYLPASKHRLKYYDEFLRLESESTLNKFNSPYAVPVRVVFLIGRSKSVATMGNETVSRIHNEAEQYNDIIQENFIDSYNNLTIKTVLALKYLRQRCIHRSAFFMKCDDDTFINIPNLLHFLLGGTIPIYNDTLEFYNVITQNRLNYTRSYMVGHLFCSSRPVANVTSKWYIPYYMYNGNIYPRYLSGAGYLMSMDVVPMLYEMALNTSLIHLEDVFITGICAQRMKLQPHSHPLFGYTRSKCLCSFKGTITQHDMKDNSMYEAYVFVKNINNRCPPPTRLLQSFRLKKFAQK